MNIAVEDSTRLYVALLAAAEIPLM